MAISVECVCGKDYKVIEAAAGKKMRCKECGEVIAIPAAAPRASSKPATAGRAPQPAAVRAPAKAHAAAPKSRPKPDVEDDPDDEYEDYGDYDAPSRPALRELPQAPPPRRRPTETQPKRARVARETPQPRDEDESPPWKLIGGGLFLWALGIGLFALFNHLETSGGRVRMPIWAIAVYSLLGKNGLLALFLLGGLASIVMGVVRLLGSLFRGR